MSAIITKKPPLLTKPLEVIDEIVRHGPGLSWSDLAAYKDAIEHLNSIGLNDREFLLEKLIVLMSRLENTQFSHNIQQSLIDILYKDLPHPPSSYLALPSGPSTVSTELPGVKYAYRSADGSNYNPLSPSLGKAGTPYARSVPSMSTMPMSSLPDPGVVFDTLLKRDKFVRHPDGISSLFFAFADLIIHSVFNTKPSDPTINNASSYLDLSPLYGSSEADVNKVRRKDGTGKLWDDVFADSRLMMMPPSVCALLVLLNRNHNFIAQKILDINERGHYVIPPPSDESARLVQDNEIFHRSRLVNTGFFMQIILGDYVGAILGLTRDGISWRLDPLQAMREIGHQLAPQGVGNAVSIEFNLLYRWHAAVSAQDTKWIEGLIKSLFPDKDFNAITPQDLIHRASQTDIRPSSNVKEWTFDYLKRDENGRFNDADLANILQNATEWPAGAFKARGTPEALRVVEIMGIEQARSWGTCSLNEFRTFMGLKAYSSFQEWNPDPEISTAAEALYHDIDNLELHVGMQAEQSKIPMPGAGLCPGYTISRAILADAVCLTRGDRFLTVDFTPFNLTAWGYRDCMFNTADGSYGGMLTKLLFRTLPEYYPAGSVYAHFPFTVPGDMKEALSKLQDNPVAKYHWPRPSPPRRLVIVDGYKDVKHILENKQQFISSYDDRISVLTEGVAFPSGLARRVLLEESEIQRARQAFSFITSRLIAEKSFDHNNSKVKFVDLVKDVINLLPVHWIAENIASIFLRNVRTAGETDSEYEQEVYEMFCDLSNYIYLNYDPTNDWVLRESAVSTTKKMIKRIEAKFSSLNHSRISDMRLHSLDGRNNSDDLLKRLFPARHDYSFKELAYSIFVEVVPSAALYSKAITHVCNFYLCDDQEIARSEIIRAAHQSGPDSDAKLLKYIYQALKSDPVVPAIHRIAREDYVSNVVEIKAGEDVYASIARANAENDHTSEKNDDVLTIGGYGLLSRELFDKTAPDVIRTIFRLKDVRAGSGQSGKLNRFNEIVHGTVQPVYININGDTTPWPNSLVIQYSA